MPCASAVRAARTSSSSSSCRWTAAAVAKTEHQSSSSVAICVVISFGAKASNAVTFLPRVPANLL